MDKLKYIIGAISLGICLVVVPVTIYKTLLPEASAVSIPNTFTDGNVLTAAQLNSNNTSIYNAFNGHDHDGSDGEPSTLSCTEIDTNMTFSNDSGFFVGDGDETTTDLSAVGIVVQAGTGDARISLEVNDAAANAWDIKNDNSDSDRLHFLYNNATNMSIGDGGDLEVVSDVGNADIIAIAEGVADATLRLRVNNDPNNEWAFQNDNSDSDNLEIAYGGTNQMVVSQSTGNITARVGFVSEGNTPIAWETYSGTTCASAPCTTTVDSSPPANVANTLNFHCMVTDGANQKVNLSTVSGNYSLVDTTTGNYEIEILVSGFENSAYTCIAFYTP